MASKSLSFLLFGEDVTAGKAFKKLAADAEASGGAIKGAFSGKNLLAVGALTAGLGLAVKGAADFQTQMVRLTTAAGESQGNLKLVSDGVMKISTATGTSLKATGDAMYYVESAGFHGTAGLTVLRAAMQGAKVEGADAAVVANALTTALTDMGAKAGPPARVMSQLVDTVAHGKLTMTDLAGSLHSVLPNATAIGLAFGQVAGAIATMTAQGISADQATQNLNHTILSLSNPTAIQTKAMAAFGLNATTVSKNLGKNGLTGTLEILTDAITKHMGPAGLTITSTLNTSQIAAQKVTEGYKALAPAARAYFDALVKGGTVSKSTIDGTKGLTLAQDAQLKQLVVLYKRSQGFSDLLKSSSPDALTYTAALAKMTGGQTGLQVALHLTGQNMTTFRANVADISKTTADASGNVKDFTTKEGTLGQKTAELKTALVNTAVEIGTQLIPVLTSAADFTLKHEGAVKILIGSLIGLKVAMVGITLAQSAWAAGTAIVAAGISGLETLYVGAMIAMDTAAGPVGLAIGAITIGVGLATKGFGLFGRSAHDQVKPVQALTDAIIADGDAFGALTRKQVENTLQTKGLYDAALKLGIGQATLTSAAMGNQRALSLVKGAIDGASKAMSDNKRPATEYIKGTLNQTQASKDAYAAWVRSQAALKDQYLAAGKLSGGLGALSGQMGASLHAANNLTIAEGKAKDAALTHAAAAAASSSKLQLESLAAQTVTTKLHGVHDAINTIPALKRTTVSVAAEIALARLQSVHDLVNSIPRSFTINIGANNNVGKAVHDAVNSIPHKAAGGTVGGHSGPTADDQLIWASTGEEVIPAGPAAKHRPLLKAITAGRFASGGTVGGVAAATQATAWAVSRDIPNLLANVLGSPAALAAALSKLINDVHTAVTKNIAPDSLLKTLENENGQFLKLAQQRKYAAAQVAAGTANLNTLRASYAQELVSVSSGVTSGFNLTSLGTGPGGPTTMGQLLALEQGNVNKAGAFAGNLGTLKGKGLTAGLISELGNAGVGSAGDVTGILAGASAGDIKQLNALYAKDQSFGNLAGRQVAGADYGAGIAAASKFVDSWSKMSKTLDAESRAMGAHIAHQVAVNVHVTAGIGANGAQIGRDIVAALEHYANNGGKITISKAIR